LDGRPFNAVASGEQATAAHHQSNPDVLIVRFDWLIIVFGMGLNLYWPNSVIFVLAEHTTLAAGIERDDLIILLIIGFHSWAALHHTWYR